MSSFSVAELNGAARAQASAAEITCCFRNERQRLLRIAFLILGNKAEAEACIVAAYELTVQGKSPFREWLFEWAKSATVRTAIRSRLEEIRGWEREYTDSKFGHDLAAPQSFPEQQCVGDLLLHLDPDLVVSDFDPFARAILVLRGVLNSSVRDCAIQLNVSREAVLAAEHRMASWFATVSGSQLLQRECTL